MSEIDSVLDLIKEREAKYVDFRFTDPRGKWQHLALHERTISEDLLREGVMFGGAAIAGWKAPDASDLTLIPDCATAVIDPFAAQTSLIVFCDVREPLTGEPYGRDPRSTAKKAERYLVATGLGDRACFSPEAEFFIFDDVRFSTTMQGAMYEIDSEEGPYVSARKVEDGNAGHRPATKGGYSPVPPVDSQSDIRAEMLSVMIEMGLPAASHHHEMAPAQARLGLSSSTLVRGADNLQIYKYVAQNVANQYGKSVTFMPKPVNGDNGSGMPTQQSLWRGERPIFAGNLYADLSEEGLNYIGGILRHAKAINAFTNPTTNSYKRLLPGFEAPVALAYSARHRSAACRIPHSAGASGRRVEVRYPDPAANPYLAFAAMLMAGLDGIENKIHPGDPVDKVGEAKDLPTICGSLREALGELRADHAFLLKGDVFTRDQIDAYAALKWEEVHKVERTPHPIEFEMYYSV
jgi:glutamine synthetase